MILHLDIGKLSRHCLAELHGAVETDQERDALFARILETEPKRTLVKLRPIELDGVFPHRTTGDPRPPTRKATP